MHHSHLIILSNAHATCTQSPQAVSVILLPCVPSTVRLVLNISLLSSLQTVFILLINITGLKRMTATILRDFTLLQKCNSKSLNLWLQRIYSEDMSTITLYLTCFSSDQLYKACLSILYSLFKHNISDCTHFINHSDNFTMQYDKLA